MHDYERPRAHDNATPRRRRLCTSPYESYGFHHISSTDEGQLRALFRDFMLDLVNEAHTLHSAREPSFRGRSGDHVRNLPARPLRRQDSWLGVVDGDMQDFEQLVSDVVSQWKRSQAEKDSLRVKEVLDSAYVNNCTGT